MEDKLFKATREDKKRMERQKPGSEEKVKEIRRKMANNEKIPFAERNILKIYDRKLEKIIRSLK